MKISGINAFILVCCYIVTIEPVCAVILDEEPVKLVKSKSVKSKSNNPDKDRSPSKKKCVDGEGDEQGWCVKRAGSADQEPTNGSESNSENSAIGNSGQDEMLFWNSIKNEQQPSYFEAFIKRFPQSHFNDLSRLKLENYWHSIENSEDPEIFKNYLQNYPESFLADKLRARLHDLLEAKQKLDSEAKLKEQELRQNEQQQTQARETDRKALLPVMVFIPSLGISFGKYEVTRAQWTGFVQATNRSIDDNCKVWSHGSGLRDEGSWRSPGFEQTDEHPAVCVSWEDATEYAAWLSEKTGKHYRLPTSDEWQTACLASQNSKYCGSDAVDTVAWYYYNSGAKTHQVGEKKPNAWGLFDMNGNVNEWTDSCFNGYCGYRIHRGGSLYDGQQFLLISYINGFEQDKQYNFLGFRVVHDGSD